MYEPRRYLLSRLLHYHRLGKLNYCVRDGNRCGLYDKVTGNYLAAPLSTAKHYNFVVDVDGIIFSSQTSNYRSSRESVEYMWPSVRPLVPVS